MDRLVAHGLRRRFNAIPKRTTVIYDWHSEEGRAFLEAAGSVIENGADPVEIGEAIGMRDFSSRWRILGRGRA